MQEDGDAELLSRTICDAVATQDLLRLSESITRSSTFCFKDGTSATSPFPDALFDAVINLMGSDELHHLEGAHELIMLFEYEWSRLNALQKGKLLESINSSYDKFTDWRCYFVLSELLGEYYCNEDSLKVLIQLRTTPNELARALLPHGFEHIAKEGKNATLRDAALTQLKLMKQDASHRVQDEVDVALASLVADKT